MEHMHAWFVSEAGSQPIDHVGVCLDQQDALEAVFEKELHLVALVGARLDHAASLNTVSRIMAGTSNGRFHEGTDSNPGALMKRR